jgi:hypothetical protein
MAAYAPLAGIPQVTQGQEQLNQNALAEYTRAAQEKAQTAAIQQQTQGIAQENQIRAQQMKDQDALTKTITQYDPSQHSISDIPKMVTANGGSGAAALQAQQGLIAQKQNYLKMTDEQFAQEQRKADLTQGVHDEVTQAAPEDKQAVYQRGLGTLSRAGVDVSQEPLQYPGDAQFSTHLAPIRLHSAIIADANKDRELAAKETEAGAKQTEAQTAQQKEQNAQWEVVAPLGVRVNKVTGEQQPINGAAMSPQMMEGKYVALQQKKAAGQELSPDDAAFVKGYEKFKTLVPAANLTMQAGLLTPEAKQMAAQLYQTTGQLPAGMRSPAMSAGVLNQAAGPAGMPTPNIAANKMAYGTETAEQKAFTSGSQGQQLTAINTARNHMQTFKDTADALDNNNFLKANQIGNYLGMQFGSDKATNFNIAKSAFAGEVGKAFAGANVGVQDRQELMDKISAASSPAQLKGYADTADKLLEGKQKSLKQSYDQAMKGQPNFGGNASETKTYQGHTYAKQSDGSWKLTQ